MREYTLNNKNITNRIEKFCSKKDSKLSARKIRSIIRSNSIRIENFHELIMEIAELSYKNPDVMLFYRGQSVNYKKDKYSTLYPSIYRSVDKREIKNDFKTLKIASTELLDKLIEHKDEIDDGELKEIRDIKLLQHSILQHYEVCKTPLLDVTQSLKVACSFAISEDNKIGYIFVLGLPYMTGRISVNSEQYITNVRLLSIGCSLSKRPFFQEGYLVKNEFSSSEDVQLGELDFNNRIVAIYEFKNSAEFWGKEVPISNEYLYPNEDIMKNICNRIEKDKFNLITSSKEIGEFLSKWVKLERIILNSSGKTNINSAIRTLMEQKNNSIKEYKKIQDLQNFRNILVHEVDKVKDIDLEEKMNELDEFIELLSKERNI